MNRVARIFLVLFVAALAIGCGEKRRGGGGIVRGVCQDGNLRPCMCPDGTMSNQVCMDDTFGACACNSTNDSGINPPDPDASTPADSSTTEDDGGGPGPMDSGEPGPMDSGPPDLGTPDAGMPSNIGQPCVVAPDSCAPTSVCTEDPSGTTTSCRQAGNAQLNQPCNTTSNNCAVGQGTCVNLGFGPRCYSGCTPQVTCSQSGTICWLAAETWGVCDLYQICDPLAPVCPSDRVCTIAQSDGTCACTAAGTAQRGQMCQAFVNNCSPGQGLCLNVGDGATCYQVCDPNISPSGCITGTCTALTDIPWGICY